MLDYVSVLMFINQYIKLEFASEIYKWVLIVCVPEFLC